VQTSSKSIVAATEAQAEAARVLACSACDSGWPLIIFHSVCHNSQKWSSAYSSHTLTPASHSASHPVCLTPPSLFSSLSVPAPDHLSLSVPAAGGGRLPAAATQKHPSLTRLLTLTAAPLPHSPPVTPFSLSVPAAGGGLLPAAATQCTFVCFSLFLPHSHPSLLSHSVFQQLEVDYCLQRPRNDVWPSRAQQVPVVRLFGVNDAGVLASRGGGGGVVVFVQGSGVGWCAGLASTTQVCKGACGVGCVCEGFDRARELVLTWQAAYASPCVGVVIAAVKA
jgi:hypothetical protein